MSIDRLNSMNSDELKAVQSRVAKSSLSEDDKSIVDSVLAQMIELKSLVEKSTNENGEKTVLASLPFGLDIVK